MTGLPAALANDLRAANENWPRFRGDDGGGVYPQDDVPTTFDVKTEANIAWSADVPIAGFSSPLVWDDRVYLSGGDESKRQVMCFDAAIGIPLWRSNLPKPAGSEEKAEVPDQSGMAAATMAIDGRHIYAIFTNGDLYAVNLDGTVAWSKHFNLGKNAYGHAASLLTWQNRLIVQLDQGDADDKLSKLVAFDGATGAVVWEQPRPTGSSWATPIVFDAAGTTQIITLSVPWVIAYSAKDGAEIWRVECLDGEVTPSPIFTGGLVLVPSPSVKMLAIRPDGHGDVTKTHIAWVAEDGIPDVTSPVSNGELVFVTDNGGVVTCYDAKTGRKQWQQDFDEGCNASPSIVGNKLYLINRQGLVVVIDATREFKEIARSPIGEQVFASPAFSKGRMFVRSLKHLICIKAAKKE